MYRSLVPTDDGIIFIMIIIAAIIRFIIINFGTMKTSTYYRRHVTNTHAQLGRCATGVRDFLQFESLYYLWM